MTDVVGEVRREQCLFYEGSWFDEEGVYSSELIGIHIFFGLPIKGESEAKISKSISFIDLHGKLES